MTDVEYFERLDRVAALIKEKPRTANDIRRALRCSKPTAYSLINTLMSRGYRFEIEYVRQAKKGPASALYRLSKPGRLVSRQSA